MLRGVLAGVVGLAAVGVVAAYVFVSGGYMPANADSPPPALEKWAARRSLHATLAREAPKETPPEPSDAELAGAVKLYAVNCAVCHGGKDGEASRIARGLYQHAPQLAKDGVEDDPVGRTYWVVKHGIRMTGMPAFGPTLKDDELWRLAWFLRKMDSLGPKASKAWSAVPSQGAAGR